jgi:hypothetical protein
MDPIATCAELALRRSPHPALKMSELLESVAEVVDRTLSAGRLRAILEAHPERFTILEPWNGAWAAPAGALLAREGTRDAWVVSITDPDGPPDDAGPMAATLRESVRWLARSVDTRSRAEVDRWYAIAIAERSARGGGGRKAA